MCVIGVVAVTANAYSIAALLFKVRVLDHVIWRLVLTSQSYFPSKIQVSQIA